MPDTTCPFDGDFCQKKQDRLDEWKRFCLRITDQNIHISSTMEMFADCPIKHKEELKDVCDRYRRYCYIVNKTMDGVEQSLRQMIRAKQLSVDYEKIIQNLRQR